MKKDRGQIIITLRIQRGKDIPEDDIWDFEEADLPEVEAFYKVMKARLQNVWHRQQWLSEVIDKIK